MKPGLKKTLKVVVITIGTLLGLCIVAVAAVLWLVLTPSRLTPMVEKAANTYLDADVGVGKVDVTFFSTFPRFTLKIDDGELVRHMTGADIAVCALQGLAQSAAAYHGQQDCDRKGTFGQRKGVCVEGLFRQCQLECHVGSR